MWILRIILILVGIACLAGLYFYMRKHPPRRGEKAGTVSRIEPEWRMPSDDRHLPVGDGAKAVEKAQVLETPEEHDATPMPDEAPRKTSSEPARICMLAVKFPDAGVETEAVLRALKRLGCTPSRDGVYQAFNRDGQTLYNVANLFEPGLLDPPPAAERLRGLALFFADRAERDDTDAFDRMLGAARDLTATLGGVVQDDKHRRLTAARELELKLATAPRA
jgi:FtsZ-interacting cell division protein ZipA